MGVIEIFGGMGKNFRVCRYVFYLFESHKYNVRQVTLLYTSSAYRIHCFLLQSTLYIKVFLAVNYYVKSVRIRSYAGPYFPALLRISPCSVRMRENTSQNNSKYGHFLRSERFDLLCLDYAYKYVESVISHG